MPGTIQVSVLDFKGLSSSSNPSSLSIKISLGKKEYQTWDKGDFSFPLATLWDHLIVTLQDAEGNEISHTGVQTMSVVEKGFWEDLFPLEGGGEVHMKLQFILSEEERNRIRIMRESAMKKKQGEILNTTLRYSETVSTVGGSVSSSLCVNHEVSDPQTNITHDEAASIEDAAIQAGPSLNPDTFCNDSQSCNVNKEGTIQKETNTIEVENSSAPMPQGVEVHYKALVESIETQIPQADVPTRPIFWQEASSMLGCSESVVATKKNSVSPKLEYDRADKPEKQGPLEKTPSNVRKMISAFESGQVQDTRAPIKPPAVKSQSNRVGIVGPLKDVNKPTEPSSGRLKNPFLKEDLQQTNITKRGEHVGFRKYLGGTRLYQATIQLEESGDKDLKDITKPAEPSSGRLKNPFLTGDLQQTQRNITKGGEHVGCGKDSGATKPSQATRELKESGATHAQSKETDSSMKNKFKSAHEEMNSKETATDLERIHKEHKSVANCEDENYSFEGFGTWIFPDDTKHLCITTGGKKVMDLFGGCCIEGKSHQGKKSCSVPHNVGKSGTDAELKKDEKTSHKVRKSRLESSGDASTGPFRQLVKVAIMIGFGTLVFLTRQREPRKDHCRWDLRPSSQGTNTILYPPFI